MRALICGFNGFGQCCHLIHNHPINICTETIKEFSETSLHNVEDLAFSWSSILIVLNSECKLSGCISRKEDLLTFTHPSEKLVKGQITRSNCVFLTKDGVCWKFNPNQKTWTDLTRSIVAQSIEGSDDEITIFTKVSCSEIFVTTVSNKGIAYNIPNVLSPPEVKVKDIACGKEHGIILTNDGRVFTWGGGSRGQLGSGELLSSEELIEVSCLNGMYVSKISAGGWHCCAVTKEGGLYTWGWNKQGQLGHSRLGESKNGVDVLAEPRFVDWPEGVDLAVIHISCGTSHTVAVLEDGTVWGCGWNKWGQLPSLNLTSVSIMTRLKCPEDVQIQSVVCGAWNTGLLVS